MRRRRLFLAGVALLALASATSGPPSRRRCWWPAGSGKEPGRRWPRRLLVTTWITDKRPDAERVVPQVIASLVRRDPAEFHGRICVGSAEECAELLSRYARAGCQRAQFWPVGDEQRQVELIAGEVMPRVPNAACPGGRRITAAGRQPGLALSRPWLATAGGGCVGRDRDRGSLERLLDERGQDLMRAAVALTGSRADGEDLLQAALERLLRNWRRVATDPEGYLRRTLYNLAADGWRSRGRWRGRLAEFRAQAPTETGREDVAMVDLRDALVRLLYQLPPRQRAVIVLRYWEQRTEAETAALLGCSEGTVKSAASRGLRRLRELARPWQEPGGGPAQDTKAELRTRIRLAEGRP
jgi:RNA polymerase sigma-70 factor (sigma-E family)